MEEEVRSTTPKMVRARFVDDTHVAVHYVNVIDVRGGQDDFFFTLGTVAPIEVTDIKDLDSLDSIEV